MSKNKIISPNVVRGGIAIPLKGKTNYYYMSGRKHKNGGIDIGQNPRTGLEVEDGEIMHVADNEIKVFSSVPFLNGESPAQKVLGGENPSTVFKQQEEFKDRNGINDDGSKKKENGGKVKNVDYKAIFKKVKKEHDKKNNNSILDKKYITRKDNNRVAPRYEKKLTKTKPSNVWDNIDKYASVGEKALSVADLGLTAAGLATSNPYILGAGYATSATGGAIDIYQGVRSAIKKDWPSVGKNAVELGLSVLGAGLLKSAKNAIKADKALSASGASRQMVTHTVGRRPKNRHKVTYTKEFDKALKYSAAVPPIMLTNTISNTLIDTDEIKKQRERNKYKTTLKPYEENQFRDWYRKVAKHKRLNPNPDADGQDYDYRGYWKNEDREGILSDNPNTHFKDKYKQPSHPTFSNQSQYSNSSTPGGEWVKGKGTWLFKHNNFTSRQAKRTHDYLMDTGEGYILGTDTIIPRSKKAMGGLSRSKDYGSKSKPYPNVKSKDFAGGNRSYPIPTKADAVDALRLAGLHKRNDVKSKVYDKYPELRKKAKAGGVYSVTVDGNTTLKRFPSTGSKTKAAYGKLYDNVPKYLKRNRDKEDVWYLHKVNSENLESDKNNVNTWKGTYIDPDVKNENKVSQPINLLSPDAPKESFSPLRSNVPKENYVDPVVLDVFGNSDLNTSLKYHKIPTYNSFSSSNNKIKNYIKEHPVAVSDAIGLTSNIIGGLISHGINGRMLDKLKYSPEPIAKSAAKLKTRININPQLDKMRESLAAYENDINNSTASSNVALARKQHARFANTLQTNNIYANRENTETELINKDRINQQSVANENIRDYNTWLQNKTTFDNTIAEKKAENSVGLIETINSGVQNMLTNRDKRRSEQQTIAAMSLANPDLPVEVLYEQKLISKKTYDAYKKAYRERNKNNAN